jgi:surface protein
MFRDASKAVVDVSTWDVSSVTNMDYMFSGATLANPDTTNWTLTALTSAINMFTNSALTYDNFDTFLARAAATNTNAVNLGTVPVSNSVSSAGSRTTLEGTHSWTINTTCPAGYAFVPDGGLAGADFCVMRYEAKDVGSSPTSQTASDPWVSISQTAAWNACDGLNSEGSRGDIDADTGGDGTYAMISNPEWMTIARNAEAVGSNWTGGATSTGIMAKGHTDSSNTAVATSTGSSCLYNTAADTCASTGTIDQRRTLTLSNGEEIWDMSGNVWEWVDWNMTSTLTTVTPAEKAYNSGDTQPISSGVEFPNLDSKIGGGDEMFPDSWQPTDTSLQSSDGVGRYFAGDNTSGGAARRGARWNSTTSAGVYTLILTVDSTSTSTYTGFRCVFRP